MPNDILQVLKDHIDKQLAEEGITPHILDCVMLDIEYSPVLPAAGVIGTCARCRGLKTITIQVYDHEHFSPLGDALIAAWEKCNV